MTSERFRFALERLTADDWARFERFASEYLISDYPALRTVAAPSGDLGRDSELFSPTGVTKVCLQYSVTENWAQKIRSTAKRIKENFPEVAVLVYVTNQKIGAAVDDLKRAIRDQFELVLDIHDRSWFVERLQSRPERLMVASRLAAEVVDPYLVGRNIVESKALALNEYEAKAAVLHLQLQWQDESRDKGLTKLSFEALVKSVLRETSSEKRMTRVQVREAVEKILPALPLGPIEVHVNSALERLDKRALRHWKQVDEFCLTNEEVVRVKDGLAQKELADQSLQSEIVKTLRDYFIEEPATQDIHALSTRSRRVLDTFLLQKGEEFAAAVAQNRSISNRDDSLDILVTNDFGTHADTTGLGEEAVTAVRSTLREVLQRSPASVQHYLRLIADSYTLFGFLRAVPDVQKVIHAVFRNGEIWLDTSVLLPVLAETLLEQNEKTVSRLLDAALKSGMRLFVTSGVVEELEKHIGRCFAYVRTSSASWVGGVPFLYAMFALTGGRMSSFSDWVENFAGRLRPADDIVDYLKDEWKIEVRNLDTEVASTEKALRWEVERIWREAHEARRAASYVEIDDFVIDRLVKHDVECYLGVLGKRSTTLGGELGYTHWWLTFDKTVKDFERKLKESLGPEAPQAPVMSPDFLADYLAVGPMRGALDKNAEAELPVVMFEVVDQVPRELLDAADELRQEGLTLNPRIVRRKLRDALDSIKTKRGDLAKGGFNLIREKMEHALRARSLNPRM